MVSFKYIKLNKLKFSFKKIAIYFKDIIASYSDDDIYLFNSSQDDDTDAKYVFKGHRNSETGIDLIFY